MTLELSNAIEEVRAHRDLHGSGSTPLMFRLEAGGAPSPVVTGHDSSLIQVLQTASVVEQARFASTDEQAAQQVATGRALATILPEAAPRDSDPDRTMAAQSMPAPARDRDAAAATPVPVVIDDRLVARADALFRRGDVSGARLLLERSMETGNARAAFLLAETYDPSVLSRIGAIGIRSDAAKARELYARALALGYQQAGERMQALK